MDRGAIFSRQMTCYICGKACSTAHLEDHIATCRRNFVSSQKEIDSFERRDLPREPRGLRLLLSILFFIEGRILVLSGIKILEILIFLF